MSAVELPARPRILVIALRRLGDVLLSTPLIRSLRRAWPDATIEALVFAGTADMLVGNPDLDGIIPVPERSSWQDSLTLARKLWRRYALAVSTQSGDRPTFFAFAAGRVRAAPVEHKRAGWLKRLLLQRSVPVTPGVHRVEEMLRLADALGIARVNEVVCPQAPAGPEFIIGGPYAVIHAAPMFRYKQWTQAGWRELAAALTARGLTIVATGGPDEAERKYLDELWQGGIPVRRLDGRLGWAQLAALLAKSRLYIGPDTSVTHLAAATGCPTVALYGPTDPRLWGPWPARGLDAMWAATGRIQQRGNVFLVQNALPCTPCQLEGCERHLNSYSQCLDELSPRQVIEAVDRALSSSTSLSA